MKLQCKLVFDDWIDPMKPHDSEQGLDFLHSGVTLDAEIEMDYDYANELLLKLSDTKLKARFYMLEAK